MKLKIKTKAVPLIINLLSGVSNNFSSIPSLVGFKLDIDGKELKPVIPSDNKSKFLYLDSLSSKKISYESMISLLSRSEINYVSEQQQLLENNISGIKFYTATINLKDTTDVYVPRNKDITSREIKIHSEELIKSLEISLLFIERNKLDTLPPEFYTFKTYNGYMTLGCPNLPVVKIIPREVGDYTEIEMTSYDKRLVYKYYEDLNDMLMDLTDFQFE